MTIRVKEWLQQEWHTPNVSLYRDTGDFDTLTNLYLTRDRRDIQRAPAWSAHITFPAGFTTCYGAYYDEADGRVYYVGQDGSNDLVQCYTDNAWSMSAIQAPVLDATATNLGGLFARNMVWRGGTLYVIDNSDDVYAGAPTGGLTQLYSGSDARIITAVGDRVFFITTFGTIYRLNDAGNGFDSFFAPVDNLEIVYAAALKNHLALVAQDGNGNYQLYYIDPHNPLTMKPVARLHTAGAYTSHAAIVQQACLFTIHRDELFFTSYDHSNPASRQSIDLYKFTGSQIVHVAHEPNTSVTPRGTVSGLLVWHDELIMYDAATGASPTQTFKILTGRQPPGRPGFTTLTTKTGEVINSKPFIFSLGDHLIMLSDFEGDEGIYHATRTALDDGSYQTSHLHFNHPGKQKRLESITVLLDNNIANFQTLIKYRTDDTSGWTTAVTAANTRRATATGLDIDFYTLQIRVELDDNTGANKDFKIQALSVIYTVDE